MSVGNLKTQGNQGNNLPYQLRSLQLLGDINVNTSSFNSKIGRIQGSANYSRTFTYDVNQNVTTIVHQGTTAVGVETITETFTYDVNQNVTSIVYS